MSQFNPPPSQWPTPPPGPGSPWPGGAFPPGQAGIPNGMMPYFSGAMRRAPGANRAFWTMLIFGALAVIFACGLMAIPSDMMVKSLSERRLSPPPGYSMEAFARITFRFATALSMVVGILFLTLAIFVRKSRPGAIRAATVLVGILLTLSALNLVMGLLQGGFDAAQIGSLLVVGGGMVAILGWLMSQLLLARRELSMPMPISPGMVDPAQYWAMMQQLQSPPGLGYGAIPTMTGNPALQPISPLPAPPTVGNEMASQSSQTPPQP